MLWLLSNKVVVNHDIVCGTPGSRTIPQISWTARVRPLPTKTNPKCYWCKSGRKPSDRSNVNITTNLLVGALSCIPRAPSSMIILLLSLKLKINNQCDIRTKYCFIWRTVLTADISQVGSCYCKCLSSYGLRLGLWFEVSLVHFVGHFTRLEASSEIYISICETQHIYLNSIF